MENYGKIQDFVRGVKSSIDCEPENRPGLYLQAFANGVDESLDGYRKAIVDTEKRFLQNPHNPLSVIYVVIYPYNRLMEYLLKIIQGIKTQKYGRSVIRLLQY